MAYQRRLRLQFLERRQLFASDLDLGPTVLSSESIDESNGSIAEGVRAAEVRIQFDPEKVSPQATDFLPGPAWQGKGAIVTNVDSNEGTVTAFLFSVEPINAASGDLIDIRLPMGPALPNETIPAFAIESITVDEGQKTIDPEEHRVDPVVSEEIKRQVQSRSDHGDTSADNSHEPTSSVDDPNTALFEALTVELPSSSAHHGSETSNHPRLHRHRPQPSAVDSIYGPSMPNWLDQDWSVAELKDAFKDGWYDEETSFVSDDSSWSEYLFSQSEGKGPSRSILLIGVRDDWSELDRVGHRKA